MTTGAFLASRRRLIHAKGGAMTLRLVTGARVAQQVPLLGVPGPMTPGQFEGPIQQNDQRVEILDDELRQAGVTGGPNRDWFLLLGGKDRAVLDAKPVMEGSAVIGWTLWVRGSGGRG